MSSHIRGTRRARRIIGTGLRYLLLLGYALFVTLPVWITLVSSLRPAEDIFRTMIPFTWRTLIPARVTGQAFMALFREYHFGRILFNSFFVSIAGVFGGVLVNALAGLAFAHFQFCGRNLLFILTMVTFMIPFEAISLPLYRLINKMGLLNTYTGLILPSLANGLVIFLFRQFFMGLPTALFESARIDGAGWFRIFTVIALPLSKPVVVSAGILMFITQWGSFFFPLLVANKPEFKVVQVAMADFFTQYQTHWNLLFAAVVVAAVIPILLLLPLQRYYVQAITQTGVKG